MSMIASPIGAPVEAPIAAVLQTFFESGPSRGYASMTLTLTGAGASTAETDGSAATAADLAAVGTTA